MALSVARPQNRSLTNPSLFRLFSTSSSSPFSNDQNDPNNTNTPQSDSPSPSKSSLSTYFSEVKASLRQRQPQMENQTQNQYFRRQLPQQQQQSSSAFDRPSKIESLEVIKKNLSEFRRRSSFPPPTNPNDASSNSGREQPISFQELYKRNVIAKSEDSAGGTGSSVPNPSVRNSFETIRQSLRQIRPNREANVERRGRDPISLDAIKNNLRLKPGDSRNSSPVSTVIGGTGGLPSAIFGKEMKKGEEEKGTEAKRMEFVKMYQHDELGEKLRSLRPKDGLKEFSLHELSERVVKLREIEEKEREAALRKTGVSFGDLRDGLETLKIARVEKDRRTSSE